MLTFAIVNKVTMKCLIAIDRKQSTKVQVALGVLLLVGGISIYLLFRSTSINLYHWFGATGATGKLEILRQELSACELSDFVRFSLPDGLYCLSYILLMDVVWRKSGLLPRVLASSVIPVTAILHELLQAAGLAKGTFDWFDLLSYGLPWAAYLLISIITNNKTKEVFVWPKAI